MVAKEESLDGITLILLRRGLGRIEALSSVATTSSKLQYLQVSNETPPPVTSDEALKMTQCSYLNLLTELGTKSLI